MSIDPPEVISADEGMASAAEKGGEEAAEAATFLSDWRRLGPLLLLSLASCATMYGRAALGPLQEAVRLGLSLSDNQMALLQGPAIALPSLLAAVPIGYMVDRYSRRGILVALGWLNAISGLLTAVASSFFLLFIARSIAGLVTTATAITVYSLVGDLYVPAKRGRAMMTVTVAEILGPSLAFLAGGLLLELNSGGTDRWREAMAWVSVPLILVALALFRVRELPRGKGISGDPKVKGEWREVWASRHLLAPVLVAAAAIQIADGASLIWIAPVLSRDFGLNPGRIGVLVASIVMGAGIAGPFFGGLLADFCQKAGGPRATFLLLGSLALVSIPAGLFAVAPGLVSAMCLLLFFVSVGFGIAVIEAALLTVIVPQEIRGLCMSLLVACGVLAGVGLAPIAVSELSGLMGGAGMVGKALSIVCMVTSTAGAIAFALGYAYTHMADEKVTDPRVV